MASVVVFCTTYMLILPAVTLTVDEAWMVQMLEPHVYINCPGAARYEASTFAGSSVPVDVLNGFDEQEVAVEEEATPLGDLPDDLIQADDPVEEPTEPQGYQPAFSQLLSAAQATSSTQTEMSSTQTQAPAQVISSVPEEPAVPEPTVAPEEPAVPEEPEEPAETDEPAEPEEPTEPEETVEPEETAGPEESTDPEESTEPEPPSETNDADAPEEDSPEISEPAADDADGEQADEGEAPSQPEESQDSETQEETEPSEAEEPDSQPQEGEETDEDAEDIGDAASIDDVEEIEDGDTPLADGETVEEQPHEHTSACYDVVGNMICEEGKAELHSLYTRLSAASASGEGLDSTLQNELPHTGGIGLTSWYTAGGTLLLAAACLLYKKLREGNAA